MSLEPTSGSRTTGHQGPASGDHNHIPDSETISYRSATKRWSRSCFKPPGKSLLHLWIPFRRNRSSGRMQTRPERRLSRQPRQSMSDEEVSLSLHVQVEPTSNIQRLGVSPPPLLSRWPPDVSAPKAAHLGKYANEEKMPAWLLHLLQQGRYVCLEGVIPVLCDLLRHCSSTKMAYLCDPSVIHVSKLRREGAFCGYRNIQMLASYLLEAQPMAWPLPSSQLPTVLDIQELIEKAWDRGFNPNGRVETGGINGTRKFIGTPEAQALFHSLGIPCFVQAIARSEGRSAAVTLLEMMEDYFQAAWDGDADEKVRTTALPPVYLQRQGHSVTVIGIERHRNDQVRILVFDPSKGDSGAMKRLVKKKDRPHTPKADKLLQPYRRGIGQLGKYDEFEILRLSSDATNTR